jgi:hypothetical protein
MYAEKIDYSVNLHIYSTACKNFYSTLFVKIENSHLKHLLYNKDARFLDTQKGAISCLILIKLILKK